MRTTAFRVFAQARRSGAPLGMAYRLMRCVTPSVGTVLWLLLMFVIVGPMLGLFLLALQAH